MGPTKSQQSEQGHFVKRSVSPPPLNARPRKSCPSPRDPNALILLYWWLPCEVRACSERVMEFCWASDAWLTRVKVEQACSRQRPADIR